MLKFSLLTILASFCSGFLFGCQAHARSESPEAIFEKAKKYTVKIKTSVSLPFSDDTKGTWTGAGFVIDAKRKWVVTNAHVASRSKAIVQVSSFGQEMELAKIIYVDPYFDIAVLEAPKLKQVNEAPLDCSNSPSIGVSVGAYGHPENYNYTGTKGIISGRTSDLSIFGDYLQTDAPINPGNSGGPLINMASGKIVGMNTAGRDKAQNMNWAVPSDQICSIVKLLRSGADPTPPKSAFDFYKDSEKKNTLKVARLTKFGVGFKVQRDDEILAVQIGKEKIKVENEAQLMNAVRGHIKEVGLVINRNGKKEIVFGNFVPTTAGLKARGIYFSGMMLGLLENVELEQFVGVEHPLHAEYIEAGSIAESKGIEKGDVITAINGVDCNSLDQAYEIISKAEAQNENIQIRVQHPGFSAGKIFTYYQRSLELQELQWVVLDSNTPLKSRVTNLQVTATKPLITNAQYADEKTNE